MGRGGSEEKRKGAATSQVGKVKKVAEGVGGEDTLLPNAPFSSLDSKSLSSSSSSSFFFFFFFVLFFDEPFNDGFSFSSFSSSFPSSPFFFVFFLALLFFFWTSGSAPS